MRALAHGDIGAAAVGCAAGMLVGTGLPPLSCDEGCNDESSICSSAGTWKSGGESGGDSDGEYPRYESCVDRHGKTMMCTYVGVKEVGWGVMAKECELNSRTAQCAL